MTLFFLCFRCVNSYSGEYCETRRLSRGLHPGAIAGIVIGVLAFIAIVAVIVFVLIKKLNRKKIGE